MDLRINCSIPALINSAGIWSIPGDLCLFSFSLAISTSKALGSEKFTFLSCIHLFYSSCEELCVLIGQDWVNLQWTTGANWALNKQGSLLQPVRVILCAFADPSLYFFLFSCLTGIAKNVLQWNVNGPPLLCTEFAVECYFDIWGLKIDHCGVSRTSWYGKT